RQPGGTTVGHSPADVAEVTVTAERLVAGGDALARLPDGQVAFVDGALPGERVVARPLGAPAGRGAWHGRLQAVLDASPERRTPAWPNCSPRAASVAPTRCCCAWGPGAATGWPWWPRRPRACSCRPTCGSSVPTNWPPASGRGSTRWWSSSG